ncbi:MAG: PQQ-like beta-propeller repeat protein [Planctomycetaceae bacterium]|nr:PQQ-like beta-propeller repeat protein [Planctomycetaceae bacterium]
MFDRRIVVCVGLICGSFVNFGIAEDWPMWRGTRGDGISLAENVPLKWSATENIAWKTPVPGVGRSSPIVLGDQVYLTTGGPADETRRVLAFDRATGQLLWNVSVHRGPGGQMHRFNTTASSTPAANEKRVYAAFVDDQGLRVAALDHSGKIVWNVTPGNFFSNHGFAASPVLYGPGVIVNGHQDGNAFVVMLDRATGKEVWRYTPAVSLRSFSTPLVIEHDGQDQLILTGSTQTVALNPLTGEKIWFAAGPSEKFVCTPSAGHGMVFSFGGSDAKRAMAVRLGGHGDVTESHIVWRNDKAMPYVPSPLLVGDFLHIVNDAGIYTCLDPVSGKILQTGRKFGPVYSSPVSAAGRIYFFEDSGRCTVIESSAEFNILAINEIGEEMVTTPAPTNRGFFVRTDRHLMNLQTLEH